jgi:futalosine hydrolase
VSRKHPIVFICSVLAEAAPLHALLTRPEPARIGRREAWRGTLDDRAVIVLPGGMGKTNAAQALTAVLESENAAAVIGFGVGGAYPGSGLDVGSIAVATEETYGDEGVDTPDGWISTEGIGIPLLETGTGRIFNRFPLDAGLIRAAGEALRAAELPFRAGGFLTVSSCSGTHRRGLELAERFGAICETMEGAAYAHVSALYGRPLRRGAGDQQSRGGPGPLRWRLDEAARIRRRAAALVARRIAIAAENGR